MSYDLAVWEGQRPADNQAALAVYIQLMDGAPEVLLNAVCQHVGTTRLAEQLAVPVLYIRTPSARSVVVETSR